MTVSSDLKNKHLPVIEAAINELLPIGIATAPPAPISHGYIGTVTNATCSLLATCAIALDKKPRTPDLNDDQWWALMKIVHRGFYSSLQAAIEGALLEICNQRGQAITSSRPGRSPEFNDYREAVLDCSSITDQRKKYWRIYFRGLSILRNKASHFDTSISTKEQENLKMAGLDHHINSKGAVHTNTKNYLPIVNKVLDFFSEV